MDLSALGWNCAPASMTLEDRDVHIWRASLSITDLALGELGSLLSPDEHTRAQRFYFAKDRHHFVAARGFLRLILASYSNTSAHALQFQYGTHGKPSLAASPAEHALCFNVSHSHGVALYAVARHAVGIDIEYIKPFDGMNQIAQQQFTFEERAALNHLAPRHQIERFYALWTGKEAFVKARGDGLAYPLHACSIAFGSGHTAPLLRVDGAPGADWSLHSFAPLPGYAAAFVVASHEWRLHQFDVPLSHDHGSMPVLQHAC